MTKLHACSQCSRHIRVDETACPFCGSASAPRGGRGPVRAALLAGALAGASAVGCGDAKPAVEDPAHTGNPTVVGQSDAMPANPVDAGQVEPPDRTYDPNLPPMPYGAPPMRKRMV